LQEERAMLLFPKLRLMPITDRSDEVEFARPVRSPLSLRHDTNQTTLDTG
jgi:hypothetical protein